MVPDRQKVWTDGRSQNYIPPTSWGDNKGPHDCVDVQAGQHFVICRQLNQVFLMTKATQE